MNQSPIKTERELYNKIKQYRKKQNTTALTSYDVQAFIETLENYLHPDIALKSIILANACAWETYAAACQHFENHMRAFRHFQIFNL
jgi:hypothetical protein